ncbi:hypothetical protein LCGC14_3088320 [marine sediment metagenome]|uniref:Uncharacterized protein n=1 Tax=marine sediment metagenome TaxID=412755 RepID=A0A0F8WB74_9ZZZZ
MGRKILYPLDIGKCMKYIAQESDIENIAVLRNECEDIIAKCIEKEDMPCSKCGSQAMFYNGAEWQCDDCGAIAVGRER